ncbi:hypothetical protein, partial [Phocaeicola dorei]|uniref:hypothetical protein n=1 Tax=Phocaeicola dorei TaxID=357276 RepID=UPI001D07B271
TCEYANTAVKHSAIVVINRFNPSILFTLSLPIFRSTSYTFARMRAYRLSVIIPCQQQKTADTNKCSHMNVSYFLLSEGSSPLLPPTI